MHGVLCFNELLDALVYQTGRQSVPGRPAHVKRDIREFMSWFDSLLTWMATRGKLRLRLCFHRSAALQRPQFQCRMTSAEYMPGHSSGSRKWHRRSVSVASAGIVILSSSDQSGSSHLASHKLTSKSEVLSRMLSGIWRRSAIGMRSITALGETPANSPNWRRHKIFSMRSPVAKGSKQSREEYCVHIPVGSCCALGSLTYLRFRTEQKRSVQ